MENRAEEYRTAAENVVSQLHEDLGVELKYDEESIDWLDGYINRIRTQLKEEPFAGLAVALGAYLGETIIKTYGGAWAYFEKLDQWGIRFDDGNGARFRSPKFISNSRMATSTQFSGFLRLFQRSVITSLQTPPQ
ncbi:MAG TPA: hypothetical protein VLL54_09830 [Pyrinomonadaceae bacterium]|nr:hypothetical protein [Pyrinomonadaceae bacterium]